MSDAFNPDIFSPGIKRFDRKISVALFPRQTLFVNCGNHFSVLQKANSGIMHLPIAVAGKAVQAENDSRPSRRLFGRATSFGRTVKVSGHCFFLSEAQCEIH